LHSLVYAFGKIIHKKEEKGKRKKKNIEYRIQKSEARSQETGDRRQKTEARRQKTEDRIQNLKICVYLR